jgi:hypothetical protein
MTQLSHGRRTRHRAAPTHGELRPGHRNPALSAAAIAAPGMAANPGHDRQRRRERQEGVIGMLRKLSRKARGTHHGPF